MNWVRKEGHFTESFKRLIKITFPLTFIIFFIVSKACYSQVQDSTEKNFRFYPLPILSYSPETRGTFGAVGLATFRFKNEPLSSRNSQFEIGAAYTQEEQLFVYMPFDLFIKNEDWWIRGLTGYYDFRYFFYGIGNQATEDQEELYDLDFFRFRIDALRLVRKHWYLGTRYWLEDYKVVDVEEAGLLGTNDIIGSEEGLVSTAGIISLWDTRDNYNYPSSGHFLEALMLLNAHELGSDFRFSRISLDYAFYKSIGKNVIASNIFVVGMQGDPPFNELAFIGGSNKMRGYYLGRYRDKNLAIFQVEWRRMLFWRIGLTAFAGFGNVAPELYAFALSNTRSSGGLGFRFQLDDKEKINFRVDYAIGERGSSGFYVAFREAF